MFGWFFRRFNRAFELTRKGYSRAVGFAVRRWMLPLAVYGVLIGVALHLFRTVPTGFIPDQDKGYLITVIQLPDGASLERTDAVVREANRIILETPGVRHAVAFAGFSGATRSNNPNAGAIFVGPLPFEHRVEHGPPPANCLSSCSGG